MISVNINGQESSVNTGSLGRFTELVELVKSYIDPDHMITEIKINGALPSEADWTSSLSQLGTAIIEIETGTPSDYVVAQFSGAPDIVNNLYLQFRQARKFFQAGDSFKGNESLAEAVRTAKAFFDWYSTILALVPNSDRSKYDIEPNVAEIVETCKKICQQQLYQAWWALADLLEKELEPRLDKLETFCRRFLVQSKAA